jgi:hypothetical protein
MTTQVSRKRLKARADENKEWHERQQREREAARQRAESQRQTPPGYKRITIEEE